MALIEFPAEVFSEAVIARIADEKFDDVGLAVIPDEGNLGNVVNQGFTIAQCDQLAAWCAKYRLGVAAFSGYMKYEEPLLAREPSRAMITRGGDDQRADSDGQPSSWLCPFRPENLDRYWNKLLLPMTRWPNLVELHLNDEAFIGFYSGAIGCYCDYCQKRYMDATGHAPPRKNDFDDPAWWRWIEYRFAAWTNVHADLRNRIRKIRPDVAVGIQHSPIAPLFAWNPWKTAIDLGRDAVAMDVLATDPYHYMHLDVVTLRPHRRLLTEGTRGLAGACLNDRKMTIYPQGFMPPGQSVPLTRQDGLLAGIVPFALGADAVSPYTYEMMNIIPGYAEGFNDAAKLIPLMSRMTPAPFVTVIAPTQSETFGHPQSDWGAAYLTNLMDVMYRVGLPWRWFWDTRLPAAADQLRGPIIVPEAHCLTREQIDAIRAVEARGEGVLWIGNVPEAAWTGGRCPPAMIESGELELISDHEWVEGVTRPVMLQSRASTKMFGNVAGRIGSNPAMILRDGAARSAWLAGMPKFDCRRNDVHGAVMRPTGGIELLRKLILWVAQREPLVRFASPPVNDYAKIRPWDRRGIHNAELFPLQGDNEFLALIFPYSPVGFDATLLFSKRVTELRDVWSDRDFTNALKDDGKRLELRFPGECELMALHAKMN